MSHLSEFPYPSCGPTLCERNSKLVDKSNIGVFDYRKISVKEAFSQGKSLACSEITSKEVFKNIEETTFVRLQNKWCSDGLAGIVDEIQNLKQAPLFLKTGFCKVLDLMDAFNQWKKSIIPKKVTTETPGKRKAMACHPHTGRIAIIAKENTVKVLNLNRIGETDQEVILRDKRVREVNCISWKPKSSISIAAGCNDGVMVWLLEPSTASSVKPGSHTGHFLSSSTMTEVSSISWSPDGKLLACTCKNSSSFWVWNILLQSGTPLHRVGPPLSFVSWSPCNQRLHAATYSSTFRIWETMTWTSEKWQDLNGRITSACWSSCGLYLLFAVSDEPVIYYTHFYTDNTKISDIGGSGTALKCADVSKVSFPNDDSEIDIGGLICDMTWDPTDSRLAVTFFDDNGACQPYIALYHTRKMPNLHLIPCGFVRGEEEQTPVDIDFVAGYDQGALLSVYWSTEEISLVPLLFNQNLLSPYAQTDESSLDTSVCPPLVDNIGEVSTMHSNVALFSATD